MKVASKLVKMDFYVGKIERKDQYLIIQSDPNRSTIPAKVRLDAVEVWTMIKAGLNWSVIRYLFALPFLYQKAKQEQGSKDSKK